MIEKNADEFLVASEVVVDARAGVVRVRLAETEQTLSGPAARSLLSSIMSPEDFTRIEQIHLGYCDKWGGAPWDEK